MVIPAPSTPPAPVTVPNAWDLKADPARIAAAAAAWRTIASGAREAKSRVDVPAGQLVGDKWSGDASDTYHWHLRKLGSGVEETATVADRLGGILDRLGGMLGSAQGLLSDSLDQVRKSMPVTVDADSVTFSPPAAKDIPAVHAAIAEAADIRADLDKALVDEISALEQQRRPLTEVTNAWLAVASGASLGWDVPPEADGTYVIQYGDNVVVGSGGGDDNITVSVDPHTGEEIVTVNGKSYRYPPGTHVTVRAGSGYDTLTVAPGTKVGFTLLGSSGDDKITGGDGADIILGLGGRDTIWARGGNDRVSGGADRDYIEGGQGDDILTGGMGDDTLYGLAGDDRLSGGEGQDYLEGATGDDTVDGDAGNDMISGGRDDDVLRGDGGDDKVYAGAGADHIDAGSGDDTVFSQSGDAVGGSEHTVTVELKDVGKYIKVEGSQDFQDRVNADLDMLRSSPRGQAMLAALDQAHDNTKAPAADWPLLGHVAYQGDTFTIKEWTGAEVNSSAMQNDHTFIKTWSQHPSIQYEPSLDRITVGSTTSIFGEPVDSPPVTVLYHEMAHVYDFENRTSADGTYNKPDNPGVPNLEREAAGLPIDDDHNPNTPDRIDPDHPYAYTENGLREELGAPHRPMY